MQASGERSVVVEVALDILKFPWWWYTSGLILALHWCWRTLTGYSRYLAIEIWIKNIFVPMFGQRDWQSRLISIFMRTVQIVGRSLVLAAISLGLVIIFAIYLFAPVVVIIFAVWNVVGSLAYAV